VAAARDRPDHDRDAGRDPAGRHYRAGAVRTGANRALDPSSKLAAAHWVGRKAYIDQLPATTADACYRAMDWLHQVRDALERQVFSQVATTLNLELDLLFFDTTSTYFEVDTEDEPLPRDKNGSPVPGGEGRDEAAGHS
jgi:hypothetical protein